MNGAAIRIKLATLAGPGAALCLFAATLMERFSEESWSFVARPGTELCLFVVTTTRKEESILTLKCYYVSIAFPHRDSMSCNEQVPLQAMSVLGATVK